MRVVLLASVSLIVLSAVSSPAHAASVTQWTGGGDGTSWSDANNWSNGVPVAGEMVQVTGVDNITANFGTDSSPSPNLGDMVIESTGAGNFAQVNQHPGTTLNNGNLTIGDTGTGDFQNSNGTHNVTGNLILGNQATGVGSYEVNGDNTKVNVNFVSGGNGPGNPNGALIIGESGNGTFTQGLFDQSDPNNQVNVAGDLVLGHQVGSQGQYVLNTGTLNVGGQLAVGGQSTATDGSGNALNVFTQNGGTVNLTGSADGNPDWIPVGPGFAPFGGTLAIGGGIGTGDGSNAGGTGTYNLVAGSIVSSNNMQIGGSGTGIMNQSGGSVDTVFLTEGFSGTGTYNLSGDSTVTLTVHGGETVGYAGTGTFNQSGGTHTDSGLLLVGYQCCGNSPGVGTYTMTGGTLNSGNTEIGDGEVGNFTMSDSDAPNPVHNVSGNLIVGGAAGGVGTYTITGDTSQLNVNFVSGGNGANTPNGALIVGEFGTGTFTQGSLDGLGNPIDPNNTVTVAGDLIVGHQGLAGSPDSVPDSFGTYTLNTGTLTVGGSIGVGAASTGTNGANVFTQNGGAVIITGSAGGDPNYVGVGTNDHVGNLFIGGAAGADNDGGTGTYNLKGGSISANTIEDGHAGTGTFNQTGGTVNAQIWLGNAGGSNGTYNFNNGIINASSVDIALFGNGDFFQTNGVSTITNELDIGTEAGQGTYTLSGGSVTSGSTLVGDGNFNGCGPGCGFYFGGSGTLTVSGGSLSTGGMTVGIFAQGTVNQSGGTVGATSLTIATAGFGGAPVDTYNLTGTGVLNVSGDEVIGVEGNGNFVQGATADAGVTQNNVTGTLFIGNAFDGLVTPDGGPNIREGSYTLNTGTLTTSETDVGTTSIGTFTQNGGAHNTNLLIVGDQNVPTASGCGGACTTGGPAPGTYNLNGGTLTASANEIIGNNGIGTFNQSDPTSSNTVTGELALGVNSGSTGTYTLTDGSVSATTLSLGGSTALQTTINGGTGTFTQNGGSVTINGGGMGIGNFGGSGEYDLNLGTLGVTGVAYVNTGLFKQTGGAFTADFLNVGIGGGENGTYTMTGGNLHVTANLGVGGPGGKGTFTQSGATSAVQVDGTLFVNNDGTSATTGGKYSISGGTLTASGGAVIGNSSGGTPGTGGLLDQTGGQVTIGATLAPASLTLGNAVGDTGTYNNTGATNTINGNLVVGAGGTGAYNLGDGTAGASLSVLGTGLSGGNVFVGETGTGTIIASDGSQATIAGGLSLGGPSPGETTGNGTLTVTGTGTSWTNEGQTVIGGFGTGALNVLAGGYMESQSGGSGSGTSAVLGGAGPDDGLSDPAGQGTATVDGTDSEWNNTGALRVGEFGAGTMTISNGGLVIDNAGTDGAAASVGWKAGSTGTVNVDTGSTWTNNGSLVVGDAGTGTVLVDTDGGNSITVGSDLVLGNAATGNGTFTLNGGTTTVTGFTFVGASGTGTFDNNGASHSTGNLVVGQKTDSNGTYTLENGGSLTVNGFADIAESGTGQFTQDFGTTTIGSAILMNGALDLGRSVGGDGTVTLSGTGAITVNGFAVVGDDGKGTFNQSGTSKVTVASSLDVGRGFGNGALTTTGVGKYNLSGGTLGVGDTITLGTNTGDQGTITQTGGAITAQNEVVGGLGTGLHTQIAGTNTISNTLTTGTASEYDLSGTGTLNVTNITNNGTFKYTGGTIGTVSGLANNGSITLGAAAQSITVSGDYSNANFGTGNSFNKHAGLTTSGGQILAAGTTSQTVSGAAVSAGTTAAPTLALGNVHVGSSTTQSYQINDVGTGGPSLRGAIETGVNGGNITNSQLSGTGVTASNYGPVAQGSSSGALAVTYNATTAGALSGQAVHIANNFDNVTEQTLSITGAAYDYANPTINNAQPIALGNFHVNDATASQTLSVTNTVVSNANFQEGLNASVGTTTVGVTGSGSFNLLAAGGTNTTGLTVGIDTHTAGAKSGTATINLASDGTGTSGLGTTSLTSQSVTVTGGVYNLAAANTIAALSFGNVHQGDAASQALSVTNTAPSGAFTEGLDAQFSGTTDARIQTSGTISLLGGQQTNNTGMVVSLNTSSTGTINGSAHVLLQSDGSGTSGLGITDLPAQDVGVTADITGSVFGLAQASPHTPEPVNFGNVRIGSTQAQALTIKNTAASDGFHESLDGQISNATTTGAATTNNGSFSLLAAQATDSTNLVVGLNTGTAGAQSGTATITLQSDGQGTSGLGITNLPSQTVNVSGNVYRLAQPTLNTPAVTLAARVGDAVSPTAGVSLTNTSPDSFTEGLKASLGAGPAGFTTSGAIANLAAGGTDASTLRIGLNTGASGTFTGNTAVNLTSTGAGTDNATDFALTAQSVAVTGKVYQTATATVSPGPINFGIVHVGDTVTAQSINVANNTTGSLVDVITGNIGSVTGGAFSGSGSLGAGVATGTSSNALQVGLDTHNAGMFNGAANLALSSHDADLADVALTTSPIALSGQVNNFAKGAFEDTGGAGTLSSTGALSYKLDFGTITEGPGSVSADLAVKNDVTGPADDLSGDFSISGLPSELSLTGFDSFTDLAAGLEDGGLEVGLDTSFASFFDVFVTLHETGSNADFSGALDDITLELTGTVAAGGPPPPPPVPEPGSLALFGGGVTALLTAARRRRNRVAGVKLAA